MPNLMSSNINSILTDISSILDPQNLLHRLADQYWSGYSSDRQSSKPLEWRGRSPAHLFCLNFGLSRPSSHNSSAKFHLVYRDRSQFGKNAALEVVPAFPRFRVNNA